MFILKLLSARESKKITDLNYFENLRLKLRWWIIKAEVSIPKYFDKEKYRIQSEYEPMAIHICNSTIRLNRAELLGNMKTQERYIKDDETGIYITINLGLVEIFNKSNYWPIKISEKGYQRICAVFDGNQDMGRRKMDDAIRSNITLSLQTIYKNIKVELNRM